MTLNSRTFWETRWLCWWLSVNCESRGWKTYPPEALWSKKVAIKTLIDPSSIDDLSILSWIYLAWNLCLVFWFEMNLWDENQDKLTRDYSRVCFEQGDLALSTRAGWFRLSFICGCFWESELFKMYVNYEIDSWRIYSRTLPGEYHFLILD